MVTLHLLDKLLHEKSKKKNPNNNNTDHKKCTQLATCTYYDKSGTNIILAVLL